MYFWTSTKHLIHLDIVLRLVDKTDFSSMPNVCFFSRCSVGVPRHLADLCSRAVRFQTAKESKCLLLPRNLTGLRSFLGLKKHLPKTRCENCAYGILVDSDDTKRATAQVELKSKNEAKTFERLEKKTRCLLMLVFPSPDLP